MDKNQKQVIFFILGFMVTGFFAAARSQGKMKKPSGPAYAHDFMPQDLDLWTCDNWIMYKNRLISFTSTEEARRIIINDMNRTSFNKLPYYTCPDDSGFLDEMAWMGEDFRSVKVLQNLNYSPV